MTGAELRARRLGLQRLGLQLTQEGLGAALGVTKNTVARWERGEMAIPASAGLALDALEMRHALPARIYEIVEGERRLLAAVRRDQAATIAAALSQAAEAGREILVEEDPAVPEVRQ